jgi:hypothetical protein
VFNKFKLIKIYIFKSNKFYFYNLKSKKIINKDNRDFLNILNKQENKD